MKKSPLHSKFILSSCFLVFLFLFLTACKSEEVYRETRFLFDTEVFIEAHGAGAEIVGSEAMEKMATFDQAANTYSANSELTKVNKAAGVEPIAVSEDIFQLLQRSLEIADLTNGIFEPTIGPLVQLWQKAKVEEVLPTTEEVEKHRLLVDYKKVILDDEHKTAFLPEIGMSLNLGAIAKGYAVELGINILKEAGISSAMVRAGGNVYTLGSKPDGTSWQIGIRDPHHLDRMIGYVELLNQVVDTSGDYEQFFTLEGVNYGHILDPRTGYPVEGIASSTVITESPALADALSTTIFILGKDEGITFIEKIPHTAAIIINSDGIKYTTASFEGLIE